MTLCSAWATTADLCFPCDDYALDPDLLESKLLAASEILYLLSGQQFPGECSETIRPCSTSPLTGVPYRMMAFTPASETGGRMACGCGTWDSCSCPSLSQLKLPRDGVTAITEVLIDGEVVDASEYRLDWDGLLVSTTDRRWPCCQNLRLADTEPGTWSIAYTYGKPVPEAGKIAVATLACELYLSCQPDEVSRACRLPANWTSIARQGVTVARLVQETLSLRQRGPVRFGINEIDMFLIAVNPYGVTSQSVFLNPDDPDVARVVGT